MIFLDRGAFCAFTDSRDSYHVIAVEQFSVILKEKRSLVTTNFIVDETYTWIRYRLGFQQAQDFICRIRESQGNDGFRLEVVTVDRQLEDKAFRMLEKYADQDLSYTDATSLALIKSRRISQVFTFDHHFYLLPVELIPSVPR